MTTIARAVQWTGSDDAWSAICDLHADSELVAFREADGTVTIETAGGDRIAAQRGDWIIKAGPAFVLTRPVAG